MIDLNISVTKNQWDSKSQSVVNHPQAKRMNEIIEEMKIKARKIKDRLQEDGRLEEPRL